MRDKYRDLEDECNAVIEELLIKINSVDYEGILDRSWVEQFMRFKDTSELTREMVVSLVDRIVIHEDKRIEIEFNFRDEMAYYREIASGKMKEVI